MTESGVEATPLTNSSPEDAGAVQVVGSPAVRFGEIPPFWVSEGRMHQKANIPHPS
jgi:hypothetical protein